MQDSVGWSIGYRPIDDKRRSAVVIVESRLRTAEDLFPFGDVARLYIVPVD